MTLKNCAKVVVGMIMMMGFTTAAYSNLSIEGRYQGKNLYVQSPESEDGFGFCVNKVTVNGEVCSHSPQASAFQIDMKEFNLKIGDKVIVVIEHEEGCKPKLLNPEVLLPKSTFVLEDISCSPDGLLEWKTTGESGSLAYQIEQYKWNKWVVIGETNGIGNEKPNEYMFNVSPHSGENKVRVTQVDITGKKRVSEEVTFVPTDIVEPTLKDNKGSVIEFVADGQKVSTKYEVFDAYGNIVKKGLNSVVNCDNLKDGVYHVNYDNKHEKFIKK